MMEQSVVCGLPTTERSTSSSESPINGARDLIPIIVLIPYDSSSSELESNTSNELCLSTLWSKEDDGAPTSSLPRITSTDSSALSDEHCMAKSSSLSSSYSSSLSSYMAPSTIPPFSPGSPASPSAPPYSSRLGSSLSDARRDLRQALDRDVSPEMISSNTVRSFSSVSSQL